MGRRPRACPSRGGLPRRAWRGTRKRKAWRKGRKAGRGLARLRRSRVPLRLFLFHYRPPASLSRGCSSRADSGRRGGAVPGGWSGKDRSRAAGGVGRLRLIRTTRRRRLVSAVPMSKTTARPSGGVLRDRRLRPVLVAPVLLDHRFRRLFFRERLVGDALDQVIDIVRTRRRRAAPHVVAVVDLAGNGEVRELPSDAQRLSGGAHRARRPAQATVRLSFGFPSRKDGKPRNDRTPSPPGEIDLHRSRALRPGTPFCAGGNRAVSPCIAESVSRSHECGTSNRPRPPLDGISSAPPACAGALLGAAAVLTGLVLDAAPRRRSRRRAPRRSPCRDAAGYASPRCGW